MTDVTLAVPFVWWGMVLAISLLETPLKFRAPGITLALGLGVGRLVFRALNIAEIVLVAVLVVAGVVAGLPAAGWTLLVVLGVLLAAQVLLVRPRLDARALAIIAGEPAPASRQHLVYVALEGVKVIVLPVLGVILLNAALP